MIDQIWQRFKHNTEYYRDISCFYQVLPVHVHDPSWGAISALGAVKLGQSSLDDVVTNCSIADSFHCGDFPPVARKDGDETLEDRIKLLREKKSQVIKRRNLYFIMSSSLSSHR